MRLLIDGVFFQLASTGIARIWASILPRLVSMSSVDVIILDRGGMPDVPGATVVPFPAYKDRYTADDSFLIQKLCDFYKIDVFTSTYYTTAVSTPMFLLVYDMIPELFGFDLSQRFWMEKDVAIHFAMSFIAISNSTKGDLLRFYPEISESSISVAYPGVDTSTFKVHSARSIETFRKKIGFQRPYFLLVGSREQHKGYKNARLFFEAFFALNDGRIDVLCLGGEEKVDPVCMALLPSGSCLIRRVASEQEIALAYGGALALVYPSLYEGFGLPVIEAMASGCPVITTMHGSLGEIAHGGACLTIDGRSVPDLTSALRAVQYPQTRAELIAAGLQRASNFTWDTIVDTVMAQLHELDAQAKQGIFDTFFARWRAARELQSSVDSAPLFGGAS